MRSKQAARHLMRLLLTSATPSPLSVSRSFPAAARATRPPLLAALVSRRPVASLLPHALPDAVVGGGRSSPGPALQPSGRGGSMTTDALPPVAAAAAAAAAAAVAAPPPPPTTRNNKRPAAAQPTPARGRKKPPSADVAFRLAVHAAAKAQDVVAALAAYDGAVAAGLSIPPDAANTVLYLCAGGDEWDGGLDVLGAPPAWKRRAAFSGSGGGGEPPPPPPPSSPLPPGALAARGREVFDRLLHPPPSSSDLDAPPPPPLRARDGEMAYTSAARMAARAGDADGALAAARGAVAAGLPPRLRTWAPALMAYAAKGDAAAALAVDEEAAGHGLTAGEVELAVLAGAAAKASASAAGGGGRGAPALPPGALASVLTRLGREHAALQPETVDALEALFKSPASAELLAAEGGRDPPARHTAWSVSWVTPDAATGAVPASAGGGVLAPSDLEPDEWDAFADGVAALARERARKPSDFDAFTAWLKDHGPFDAVVDGANVALYGQNWEHGGFDWGQLGAVLDALARERDVAVVGPPRPSEAAGGGGGGAGPPPPPPRALVILHRSRTGGPSAATPLARRLLAALTSSSCFYAAPHGCNDDWFWLYAALAARGRGLLISNDEMRDHVFQLLSPRFFARWKGRHQVKYEVGPTGGSGCAASNNNSAGGGSWGAGRYASLSFPPPYSVCAQRLPSGAWFVPATEPPTPGAWLCARPVSDL